MRSTRPPLVTALLAVLLAACSAPPEKVEQRGPVWERQFELPVGFQSLVDEGLLVVGTARHLYGFEPAGGRRLWRIRNVRAGPADILSLGDVPYILVNDASGGSFGDAGTHILAVGRSDGRMLWESPLLKGKVLQAAVDPLRGILFAVTVPRPHGDDRGVFSSILPGKGLFSGLKREPQLNALELSTGRLLWRRPFGRKVAMRPSYRPRLGEDADWVYTRPFTLGLYHPPLVYEDRVCVTYGGLACYDGRTGAPLWSQALDVMEGALALSYAAPVLDDDRLYMAADSRIRAFDPDTGKPLWRSRRLPVVPALWLDRELVYGQLGGRFFDIKKEEWVWKGRFGAVAVDKASGKTRWKYDEGHGAVTNLLVAGERVWLADADRLLALDRRSGRVVVEVEHELQAPPVYLGLNDDRRVLLVGETEAAAFHPVTGKPLWHLRHRPVGPSAWRRFSAGLMEATGKALRLGSFVVANVSGLLPAIPALSVPLGGARVKLINTKSLVADRTGRTSRRLSYQASTLGEDATYAHLRGGYQYFITKPRGHDQALAVVNLRSGRTERLIVLPSRYPNLVIDEVNGRIYQAFGRRLVAVPL